MFLPSSLLPLNHPAPAFRLMDNHGRSIGSEDFNRSGGLVLLFFSTDWLAADLRLLRHFSEQLDTFQSAQIEILGISSLDWEKLHRLGQQLAFPLLCDVTGLASKAYQTALVPKFITRRAVYAIQPQDGSIVLSARSATSQEVLTAFQQSAKR